MTPTIVHASQSQRDLLDKLARIAHTTAEVLITGPSGVGKELYANYVHAKSARRNKPFVAVNCSNLSNDMFENEIFGHTKGAFTGAVSSATGLAVAADGGTLFLDEIDALPMACQAKILRFTQLREYRRLGEAHVRRSDVRLITACNCDLLERVSEGSFREDLYFRVRVVPIEIPPLAERPEDVEALLRHFVGHYAKEYELAPIEFSPDASQQLTTYSWPGNVRELENCVRYLTCLGMNRPITPPDLPLLNVEPAAVNGSPEPMITTDDVEYPDSLTEIPFKDAKAVVVNGFEKMYVDSALRAAHGNVAAAARRSGKHRRAFFELMRRQNIRASSYKVR